jgi:hypothetical protein
VYKYEVLEDSNVLLFTRSVVLQIVGILKGVYLEDYTKEKLEAPLFEEKPSRKINCDLPIAYRLFQQYSIQELISWI